MQKALAAAALSLLIVPSVASSAAAQSLHRHALTAEQLAQVAEARSRVSTPATQVARQGTLQVTANFTKQTAFTLPVQCSADITVIPLTDTNAVIPEDLMQSQTVQFTGRSGTCTLSMDYNWPSIGSDALLFVTLSVITDPQAYYRNGVIARPVANVTSIFKAWAMTTNPIPPANGVTVYDFGDLSL